MLGTGHSGRLAHKLSSRLIVKSSPAWAACLRVSGRSGIIGQLAHVACVAVGNTTLDSTTLLNARLSGATADPATPPRPGIVDGGMHAEKTLGRARRLEALHFVLSSSHRLMRIFGSAVLPAPLYRYSIFGA